MPVTISRTAFRPQISLNLPQLGATTAAARRKADPIQVDPDVEWEWSAIVGRAVETIVMSRAARKTAILEAHVSGNPKSNDLVNTMIKTHT